jgi:hypothetical protein
MWCDNCLLVLPLRAGAIAWGVAVAVYSMAGGLFLLIKGQFLYFNFPEWQIYGGIGVGVASVAIVTIIALSNRSYIWTRVCKFLWPFLIVICGIRAIIMLVQLQRGQSKIEWECNNGGQLWTDTAQATTSTYRGVPTGFCSAGFKNLYWAFIFGLLADLVCQLYMFFLTWRFSKRLEHYADMKGPFAGGYYA